MTKAPTVTSEIDLKDSQYYFNRELSWLEFNHRVLHEALDPRTPLFVPISTNFLWYGWQFLNNR